MLQTEGACGDGRGTVVSTHTPTHPHPHTHPTKKSWRELTRERLLTIIASPEII